MKKQLLIPVLLSYSIFNFLNGYADSSTQSPVTISAGNPSDTITNQLSAINLSQYNGKPVDSLLAHLPSGYTTMKIGG